MLWSRTCLVLAVTCLSMLDLTVASTVVMAAGHCPSPGTQADFDMSKFAGVWHELESFDRNSSVCVSIFYSQHDNETYNVSSIGYIESLGNDSTIHRTPITIKANAYAPNASSPAELRLTYPGYNTTDGQPNYFIVSTDYVTYAVIYSCSSYFGDTINIHGAWILTRDRGVAPSNLTQIKDELAAAGVLVKNFGPSNQSNCEVDTAPLTPLAPEATTLAP
ncbi:apolipoprotein D-like [Physella acuta]|uniref:apolipoprotein D-like n=1 Tax=Physella acuta TaxID=109671 RepID=UPI0027DC93A5|nr:apolipoprotein D-like [Physella acuta]